jgi:L-fucose mutarotase/ribose pyranase (RbsD/FucU family)
VLKNLSPVITVDLLRVLESIQPGQSLAILSDDNPYRYLNLPSVQVAATTVEQAVEAIFSALPLAHDGDAPLLSWFADTTDENTEDIGYAIRGLASDAELRPIEMTTIVGSHEFAAAMSNTVATLAFHTATSPWAFLIRAGA